MTTGDIIRASRLRQHLGLQEAASRAGLTKAGLWKIETGRSEPKIESLRSLAAVLGCRVSELIPEMKSAAR